MSIVEKKRSFVFPKLIHLFLVSFIVLSFSSCESEDNDTPEGEDSPIVNEETIGKLPERITHTYPDGFINSWEFEYEGNRLLKHKFYRGENLDQRLDYIYENGRLIRIEVRFSTDFLRTSIDIMYEGDFISQVVEKVFERHFDTGEGLIYLELTTTYTVSADGYNLHVVRDETVNDTGNPVDTDDIEEDYFYNEVIVIASNGSLVRNYDIDDNNKIDINDEYYYDDKNNIFKNIDQIEVINLMEKWNVNILRGTVNNLLTVKNEELIEAEFNYEYDADDYPISGIKNDYSYTGIKIEIEYIEEE